MSDQLWVPHGSDFWTPWHPMLNQFGIWGCSIQVDALSSSSCSLGHSSEILFYEGQIVLLGVQLNEGVYLVWNGDWVVCVMRHSDQCQDPSDNQCYSLRLPGVKVLWLICVDVEDSTSHSRHFLQIVVTSLQITSPIKQVQVKDIGLGYAASWPGCPHHWCQPLDIWGLWSRSVPLLQCWTLGPGTPCALHSTDWSSS